MLQLLNEIFLQLLDLYFYLDDILKLEIENFNLKKNGFYWKFGGYT
jgi:hypothetical protein